MQMKCPGLVIPRLPVIAEIDEQRDFVLGVDLAHGLVKEEELGVQRF